MGLMRPGRLSVFGHAVVWLLVLDTFLLSAFPRDAVALLIPAVVVEDGSTRVADLEKVQAVLEDKLVRQRLADVGLNPEEVEARLAAVSDADLHQLAMNLDGLLPGGDVGLGFLLALVIVLLIIVVIYLAGYRINITKERY